VVVIQQPGDDTSSSDSSGGDLASDLGDEIRVTLDRWSVGQLGVDDLLIAAGIVAVGAFLAWLSSRIAKRLARRSDGPVRAAIATTGLLVASVLMLLAGSLALEVLGFSLGPILVLIIVLVVVVLLLRPILTNLSSGVLLQVRGALEAGDLVRTNGLLGVVHEINARTVVLDTSDGRRVHIPSTEVLGDTIENYTTLGRRRSSIDFMVSATDDLDLVMATVSAALMEIEEFLGDPPPEVQRVRLVSEFVVLRAYAWHEPSTAAQRSAVDAMATATVSSLAAIGVQLGGPQLMQFDALGSGQCGCAK
jgi:small conductance mechanosensitive channel